MKTAIKANGIGEVEIEFTDEYKNGGGYYRTVVLSKNELEALKEILGLPPTSQSEEDEFEKWCLENGIVDVFQYGKPILRAAFEAGSKSGRTMKEIQAELFKLTNENAKLKKQAALMRNCQNCEFREHNGNLNCVKKGVVLCNKWKIKKW